MNQNLEAALNYLGLSVPDRRTAFINYLFMAGYLSPELIKKAVTYLNEDVTFSVESSLIITELNAAVQSATNQDELINIDTFFDRFGRSEHLKAGDLTEIIFFLQQTAFDREFGVERDRLTAQPWMQKHTKEFLDIAQILGLVDEHSLPEKNILGIAIMGAASARVQSRIQYFMEHFSNYPVPVWALSGNRELSKGLDSDAIMEETAQFCGVEVDYRDKQVGKDTRTFLHGVTETQMVHYLLRNMCPEKTIGVIDSKIQESHWRATTRQNATDIAKPIVQKALDWLNGDELNPGEKFTFIIIAEQPHSLRMAMDVQRAISAELTKEGLLSDLIRVIGCGQGLDVQKVLNESTGSKLSPALPGLNSALATLTSAWYQKARDEAQPGVFIRNTQALMFSSREDRYRANVNAKKEPSMTTTAPGL